jgi:uncharacterized membrane protein YraQ (UPF0718 family)
MDVLVIRPFGKRFVLALLLVAVLAVQFWTQSRYPSLNEKAMMSGAIQLEDSLSFEAYWPVLPEFPAWKRVLYSTVNWIKTNERGMTFGVLFAAAFLTLLGYIRRHSFRGGFANSFLGLAVGTPLGVCVNCAAPIAKGLYSGGVRAETTLSAMIASPTLNIVVLTMLFSIMPFYMAVGKIALSLFVILLAVPILCRFLPERELQIEPSERPRLKLPSPLPAAPDAGEGPFHAVFRFAWDYALNLWFIIKTTVPLMLLAGFLGAVVTTFLPTDMLREAPFGLTMLTLAAIVGTFLPVPIGFDVVVTGALMNVGLQPGYTMALLFTLGIFSVYSFFIIAGAISLRAATLMAGVVVVLGILAGLGAEAYHKWQTQRALRILTSFDFSLIGAAQAAEAEPYRVVREGDHGITVYRQPFRPRSPAGEKPFTRIEAWHLGIDQPIEFSFGDMWPPFWEGRSIAAGDFDGDGNVDLILASTERGLYFYRNDGAGRLKPVAMPIGRVKDMPVFNAALVDIDNDGWLDLFIATYQAGNYLIRNVSGVFDVANMTAVKNREDAVLAMAVSFGDVNRDGHLDLAFGNWAAGWYRRVPGEEARNRVVFNEGGSLTGEKFVELPGPPGETLSILLTDIDMDGKLDLLEANDFEQPDVFYLGDGAGGFRQIKRQDGIIPHSTTTTMAVKTADLHNTGGRPDIYLAQIAGRSSGVSKTLKMRSLAHYCEGIERASDLRTCEKNMQTKRWYKSGNNFDPTYAHKCLEMQGREQAECKGMLVKDLAIQNSDPRICGMIPAAQVRARQFCEIHFRKIRPQTEQERAENIPQILRRNVLLVAKGDGSYDDRAVQQGLDIGGWSWDVKIADVDNDGFQDIYVVNGTWIPHEVSPSNLFFLNTGKGGFKEMSGPFGLEDYFIMAAAVAVDLDNDGDIDFVAIPVNAPVMAFINNSQSGNAIAFELRDHAGNRFGIGSKVEIRYGENGALRQMREIQLGGGFMSFDAPVAHFGIGAHEKIESVTISWANGGHTVIQGGLTTGARYRIERAKDAAAQ